MRKKCSSDQEKHSKFEAEGREFAKILRSLEQFEIFHSNSGLLSFNKPETVLWTIAKYYYYYSNSKRSEQFWVTECFFNLFLEVSHIS